MSRLSVVSVLVVLVGAGVWLVVRGWLAGERPHAVAPSPAAVTASQGDGGPHVPRAPGSDLGALPTGDAGATRQAATPATAEDRFLEILVVTSETGEPVPGASLLFASLPAREGLQEHPGWRPESSDRWLSEHGARVRADSAGRARLVPSEGALCLVAGSAAGLWGREAFELDRDRQPGAEPRRLELGPDSSIRVAAVDPSGAPLAAVPVALRQRSSGWMWEVSSVRTGEDGRARFAHVPSLLAQGRHAAWSLAAAVQLAEPVEVEIDPQALPTDEVVLVLPGTGSLEVVVEPLPEGPPVGAGHVDLMLYDERRAVTPSFWFRPDKLRAEVVDGRAVFSHVGLGLELMAEAYGESSAQPTLGTGPGPRRADERARITIVLGSDHPVLRLRAVDAEREPLREIDLKARLVTFEDGERNASEESRATDAEGVLWLDVPRLWGPGAERALELQLDPSPARAAGGLARIDLTRDLASGLVDLGDVVLQPAQVLVAGLVLAAGGAPAAGASIEVSLPRVWGEGQVFFEPRDDLATYSDSVGRFEVLGDLDGDELRLSASKGGLHAAPVDCRRGAREVRIELREGGLVAGRVLLDEGVDPATVNIVVLPADERGRDWKARRSSRLSAGGRFEVTEVLPGLHDVRVDPRGSGAGLVVAEDVIVRAGEVTVDPRLDPVDLRGRLVSFDLELVPPRAGDAVVGVAEATLHGGTAGTTTETLVLQGARQSFCLQGSSVDLALHVTGCRTVELRDVRGRTRVELRRGLPVRLRLVGEGELPAPPRYLKAFLSASEPPQWGLGRIQDEVFDERRELLLWAERPGRQFVGWLVEERSEDMRSTTELDAAAPQTVDVLDVDAEQVFDVALPVAALAAALEAGR